MSLVAERGTYSTPELLATWVVPVGSPTAIAVGNTVIISMVASHHRSLTSITDTAGNTWNAVEGDLSTDAKGWLFWTTVTTAYGTGAEVSITFGGGAGGAATVAEYTPVTAVDVWAKNTSGGVTVAPWTTGPVSTAGGSLLVGVLAHSQSAAASYPTVDTDGAWTQNALVQGSEVVRTVTSFWRSTGAAGSRAFDGEITGGRRWSTVLAAFVPASAVDAPTGLTVTAQGAGLRAAWTSGESEFVLQRERWTAAGTPP